MHEPVSLLELIKRGGYEASLFTTFNASLPFYEEVVLRKLVSGGCRHNVVLMDAKQLASAWETQSSRPRMAGYAYTLLPIHAAGAFHPKLCLLVGSKKATILIGSHNLTLSGIGFNHEITNWFEIKGPNDKEGTAVLSEACQLLQSWIALEEGRTPQPILTLANAMGNFVAPLLVNTPSTSTQRILSQGPNQPQLIDQLAERITGEVKQIGVLGAFFDNKLTFLKALHARWPMAEIVVGMDPDTVHHPGNIEVRNVRYVNARELWRDDKRYLHAKALMVCCKNPAQNVFFSGSANPSYPAWMGNENARNIEAMVWHWGIDATNAAKQTGLEQLHALRKIDTTELTAIANHDAQKTGTESTALPVFTGFSVEKNNLVHIRLADEFQQVTSIKLFGSDGELKPVNATTFRQSEGWLEITAGDDLLTIRMCVLASDRCDIARAMITHPAELEMRACSTQHHDLVKQVLSLSSELGDISSAIRYVARVIFSNDADKSVEFAVRQLKQRNDHAENITPATLEISIADIKNKRGKLNLANSGDIGNLIDLLLRNMSEPNDRKTLMRDQRGRTEEELIGADDASDNEIDLEVPDSAADIEIAQAVSRKTASLCRRMSTHLEQARDNEKSAVNTLIRLLAILALLCALRKLDKTRRWRATGTPLVSEETRWQLLSHSLTCLLKSGSTLLDGIDNAVGMRTDDSLQLRSFLVWLAWDLKMSINPDAADIFDANDREIKLRANALFVRLMPAIANDSAATLLLRTNVLKTTNEFPEARVRAEQWLERHLNFGLRWLNETVTSTHLKPGSYCRIPNVIEDPAVIVQLDSDVVGLWDFDGVRTFKRDKALAIEPVAKEK